LASLRGFIAQKYLYGKREYYFLLIFRIARFRDSRKTEIEAKFCP